MKHIPVKTEHESNISRESPLRGLGLFVLCASVFLVSLYLIIGFTSDLLVDQISLENESKIFKFLKKTKKEKYKNKKMTIDALNTSRLEYIFKQLLEKSELKRKDIAIQVYNEHVENAYAFPDGNIYVTKKLVEMIPEDSDLAMVIAHELGHFHNRDHLKGLGRVAVVLMASLIFMGETITNGIIVNLFEQINNKHNRDQETKADFYGVDLLYKTYGNTKGALGYFEHMEKSRTGLKALASYLNTHPTSKDRIERIKKLIGEKYK